MIEDKVRDGSWKTLKITRNISFSSLDRDILKGSEIMAKGIKLNVGDRKDISL